MINARSVLFGTNLTSVGRSCGTSGISAYSLKLMRPLVDSSITFIKVKVFKERPARTFLPRLVHSLFPYLVSLCEVVNSSFVLRASAVEPAFFISLDKLSHNGLFLPDEDGCLN